MAVKKIHEIPTELPHAHLYLDDIEEISKILLEGASPEPATRHENAEIHYVVGDLQMDTIEDLREYGGSVTDLLVIIGRLYFPSVQFIRMLNPTFLGYALPDEQERWAAYARIKSIFFRRQLRIKNALESLPKWLKILLFLLFCVAPALLGRVKAPFGLWGLIVYVIIAALLLFEMLRPSRVFFMRSRERSKASSTARRGYVRDIAFILLGAVLAELAKWIFGQLFK